MSLITFADDLPATRVSCGMSKISVDDLEPQLAANRRYWTGWSGADADADLVLYRTDIQHVLLNGVLRVRHRSLDTAVQEACDRLDGSEWNWWVASDSDVGTEQELISRGAELRAELPIMAIDIDDAVRTEKPGDIQVRPVVAGPEMREYVAAYSGPLGLKATDLDALVDRELNFGYPDVVRLAGVIDGRIVGTCTVSLGSDVAALYCVATDPEFRQRGVATELTQEALRIARRAGRQIVTLQASEAGARVYQRVGFRTVGDYRLFRLPK